MSATTAGTGNTASDTLTVNPVNPGISILKQVGTSITGPWTTLVAVTTGTNIFFQMTVENIGDVALTDANVTDPTLTGLGVDLSGCAWALLPLFDVQTCVVGPIPAVAGSHANSATSHGTFSSTEYDSSPSTATYATTGQECGGELLHQPGRHAELQLSGEQQRLGAAGRAGGGQR